MRTFPAHLLAATAVDRIFAVGSFSIFDGARRARVGAVAAAVGSFCAVDVARDSRSRSTSFRPARAVAPVSKVGHELETRATCQRYRRHQWLLHYSAALRD
jgi:hypothetical protein